MGFCTPRICRLSRSLISDFCRYFESQNAYLCEGHRSIRSSHAFPVGWPKHIPLWTLLSAYRFISGTEGVVTKPLEMGNYEQQPQG